MDKLKSSVRYGAFLFVAIASFVSTAIFVDTTVGNLVLGIAILIYASISDYKFVLDRLFIFVFFAIFAWYAILIIAGGGALDSLFRLLSYLIISFVCIFLIPSEIEFSYFTRTYTWLITVVVVVGLLTKAGFSTTILGSEITTVPYSYNMYYFVGDSVSGEAIRSIFSNQNTFAPIVFFGAVFSLFLYQKYRYHGYIILFGLNFIGLYFSRSRSAMLAFFVTLIIYIFYIAGWHRLVAVISIGSIPGILTISAIASGVLPGPIYITEVAANRVNLWEASVEALFDSHFVGAGPVASADAIEPFVPEQNQGATPHNAFLAMFATGGLIGGVGYVCLFFYTYVVQIRKLGSGIPIVLIAITVGIAFLQLFEAYLLFGFTTQSVLIALTIGYAIQFSLGQWDEEKKIQRNSHCTGAVGDDRAVRRGSE